MVDKFARYICSTCKYNNKQFTEKGLANRIKYRVICSIYGIIPPKQTCDIYIQRGGENEAKNT